MSNISYGCHGIQDKHKWCSSISHFVPNSTTYTCHCYFLLLAMTSINDVPCDKHWLNLIHLSQTIPTIYQKKQNFSKKSVMYLTQFPKKFLNTSYERQLCIPFRKLGSDSSSGLYKLSFEPSSNSVSYVQLFTNRSM